jgi:uncharacterized heparinase superfamily protein
LQFKLLLHEFLLSKLLLSGILLSELFASVRFVVLIPNALMIHPRDERLTGSATAQEIYSLKKATG